MTNTTLSAIVVTGNYRTDLKSAREAGLSFPKSPKADALYQAIDTHNAQLTDNQSVGVSFWMGSDILELSHNEMVMLNGWIAQHGATLNERPVAAIYRFCGAVSVSYLGDERALNPVPLEHGAVICVTGNPVLSIPMVLSIPNYEPLAEVATVQSTIDLDPEMGDETELIEDSLTTNSPVLVAIAIVIALWFAVIQISKAVVIIAYYCQLLFPDQSKPVRYFDGLQNDFTSIEVW